MAISDAQFSAWLASDVPRVVLCELAFAYEAGGVPAQGTIYISDQPYVTGSADSPPGVRYHSVMRQAPRVRRALDRRTLGGRAELTVSDMTLVNDGSMDFLLGVILDGYEARYYLGAPQGTPGWTRADFRLAFVAVAERVVAPSDQEIVVKLRDKRLLLDREVVGNQVGGSGAEASQFLPIINGSSFNVSARIYDSATATWAVLSNYVAGALAYDVREAGLTLSKGVVNISGGAVTVDAGTDVFTLTAHGLSLNDVVWFKERPFLGAYTDFAPFAGMVSGQQYWVTSVPTANTFTLSATKGGSSVNVTSATYLGAGALGERMLVRRWYDDLPNTGRIQLSSSAVGTITVDVKNGGASGPFSFMKDFILGWGKVSAADVDAAAFTAADADYSVKIGAPYHNYTQHGRGNLVDILDRLSKAAFGWFGQSRTGLLTCGLIDLAGLAAAAPVRSISGSSLVGPVTVENDQVAFGRATVEYNANQTVQGDGIHEAVSESDRRRFAVPFLGQQRSTAPAGTAYATNPGIYHKTMVEAEPSDLGQLTDYVFGLAGITLSFPTDIADKLVANAAPHRQFINAQCRLDCYEVDLGQVVSIAYPRYGMSGGVNAIVIGALLDISAGRVDLELVRRRPPETAIASYH